MDLIHVNGQACAVSRDIKGGESSRLTSCCVQSSATSFAFEVFSFLMGDENFQVIEITLTCDNC
jgi:hypothetical protein